MRRQINQTGKVRTGTQYGGIVRDQRGNYQQSDNYYNDEYYATDTVFDRFGRRMNNANLGRHSNQYEIDRRASNEQYQTDRRYSNSTESGYGTQPNVDRRFASSADDVVRAEQQRAQHINSMEYNSAVLEGRYHNLDNPKGDIRDYGDSFEASSEKEVQKQGEE